MKSERTTTAQFPYVRCLDKRHMEKICLLTNGGLIYEVPVSGADGSAVALDA
jgi:hypothetical protein